MRGRFSPLSILSLSLLFAPYSPCQLAGSIQGTVVNEKGMPVPVAQVRVDPLDGRPRADAVLIVETDRSGHFLVSNLELESYKLFAMKESLGYADTAAAFYSNNVFPTVTLTASVPTVDITLRVGPPAGVLSGRVSSAVSGDPVPGAILLRRVLDPGYWISMSQKPDYRVLLPPSAEVIVEVSAPGFKTWYYGGPSDALKRAPIRLESGKEMKLDIQLEPEVKPLDQQ
jgi:hypothetical protein